MSAVIPYLDLPPAPRRFLTDLAKQRGMKLLLDTTQYGGGTTGAWVLPGAPEEWCGRTDWPVNTSVVVGWSSRRPTAFWCAMHELGHQALDHQLRWSWTPDWSILQDEVAAWDWALDNAPAFPGPETADWIAGCIESYQDAYPRHSKVQRKINKLLRRLAV